MLFIVLGIKAALGLVAFFATGVLGVFLVILLFAIIAKLLSND